MQYFSVSRDHVTQVVALEELATIVEARRKFVYVDRSMRTTAKADRGGQVFWSAPSRLIDISRDEKYARIAMLIAVRASWTDKGRFTYDKVNKPAPLVEKIWMQLNRLQWHRPQSLRFRS